MATAACNTIRAVGGREYVCIGDRMHGKDEHYFVEVNYHEPALIVGIINALIMTGMMVFLTIIVCLYVFA